MVQNIGGERANCANCRFSLFQMSNPQLLSCAYEPPRIFMAPSNRGIAFLTEFPQMRREQWCGKHEKRRQGQEVIPAAAAAPQPHIIGAPQPDAAGDEEEEGRS